jgi:hypothetical protein
LPRIFHWDKHLCRAIPCKHAHCAPAASFARVRLRNFCLCKRPSFLASRRFAQENPTLCSNDLFGINGNQRPNLMHTRTLSVSLQVPIEGGCAGCLLAFLVPQKLAGFVYSRKNFSRVGNLSILGHDLQPGTRLIFCGWPLQPGCGLANCRCLSPGRVRKFNEGESIQGEEAEAKQGAKECSGVK